MALALARDVIHATVSFAASDKSKTYSIPTAAVVRSKTLIFVDYEVEVSGRPNNLYFKVSLNSAGDTVTITRAGASTTPDVTAVVGLKIVEFASGITVNWVSGTSLNSNVGIGATVDQSRTFAMLTTALDGGGSLFDNNECIGIKLVSDTQFQVKTSSTLSDAVDWCAQIAEFASDSGGSVQFIEEVATGQVTTHTLGTPVAANRTAVIGSSQDVFGYYVAISGDGATLTFTKWGGWAGGTFWTYLVTFPDPVRVQRVLHSGGESASPFAKTVTDILDWDRAVPFTHAGCIHFSHQCTGFGLNPYSSAFFRLAPGASTNELSASRNGTGGYGYSVPTQFQVIGFDGMAEPTPPWTGNFRSGVAAMPENRFRCPMLADENNNWSAVVTPEARQPVNGGGSNFPLKIFQAWPGFVIDEARAKTVHYGGGHANYGGNDVYECDLDAMQWRRIALPSNTMEYGAPGTGYYGSVGGHNDAPAAAHTYAGLVRLPLSDRMMLPGGAAFNTGGAYLNTSGGFTGPYLLDLSKADANKVGGATGTGRITSDLGLQMWQNIYSSNFKDDLGNDLTNIGLEGTQVCRIEDGKEVIYRYANRMLHRIVINTLADPSTWTCTRIGYDGGHTTLCAAGFDFGHNLMVAWERGASSLTNSLIIFDLNGPANGRTSAYMATPSDPDGVLATLAGNNLSALTLLHDPVRDRFVGWDGYNLVTLTGPGVTPTGSNDSAVTTGWVLHRWNFTRDTDYRRISDAQYGGQAGAGFGKIKYWRDMDVFLVAEDGGDGAPYLWVLKPENWSPILQAAELTGSAPIIGSPALGQDHSLSAAAIVAGQAEITAPSLTAISALVAQDLTAAQPEIGTPAISQSQGLAASDIAAGQPEIGAPALGQDHALSATAIVAGQPEISAPALGQDHVLAAVPLTAGQPEIGTPALSGPGVDALSALDLVAGAAEWTQPPLGQIHVLTVADLVAGAPEIGLPSLAGPGVDVLSAADLVAGQAQIDVVAIGQVHALIAMDIGAGAAEITAPALGQTHSLAPLDLVAAAALIGRPSLNLAYVPPAPQRRLVVVHENRRLIIR